MARELEALGVAPERITIQDARATRSRMPPSPARSRPKPGDRWLLVTSALHMPRAMAAFRAAKFCRGRPVRLAHARAVRQRASVFLPRRRSRTDRCRRPRMDRPRCIPAQRQDRGTVSRALTAFLARTGPVCSCAVLKSKSDGRRMGLHLIIGNKNYSSWSFRPWIALKVAGIAFDETVIPLDAPTSRRASAPVSGTPARCRCWSTVTTRVWELLAILEYSRGKIPGGFAVAARSAAARAHARTIASEMHAEFPAVTAATADECAPAGRALAESTLMPPATSRASTRSGRIAVPGSAGRFCSARSEPLTRCRRSSPFPHLRGRGERGIPGLHAGVCRTCRVETDGVKPAAGELGVLAHDGVEWPEVRPSTRFYARRR